MYLSIETQRASIALQGADMSTSRVVLNPDELPKQWYNLAADLPAAPRPYLGPDGKPVTPEMMAPIFPMNLIEQEMSTDRWIDIPEGIREVLYKWRPSPLHRAYDLEKAIGTPARIYYKNESVSPAGSHKPNSAIAQAWYNKQAGTKRMTTETGAGQWGSALAFACAQVGLELKVFMVRVSFEQKPYRKVMMQTWGAECISSPSDTTEAGRKVLSEMPDTPGSLGIAISEAVEAAVSDPRGETKYGLGSVLNHVMLHQTVIGQETKLQLAKFGESKPDVIIGCAGGGSNFAGMAFPFVADKIAGADIDIIPIEPFSCPSITRGAFTYDIGDKSGMTPLMAMFTLGHDFIPSPIHAGGLRYHGMSPLVSAAVEQGLLNPRAVHQMECFDAAVLFARTEGIIVAPETSHAVAGAIQEAKKAKEEGKEKVIVFNLSGHGLMDLKGYQAFFAGELADHELPQEEIQVNLARIAGFPKI